MGAQEPVLMLWRIWEFNPFYSVLQGIFQTLNKLKEKGEGVTFSTFL
jgi:hypothetical protein